MLSNYARENSWKDLNEYKQLFYDEFGNRKSEPIVECYYKNSDGEWKKDESFVSSCNCYVIDGQVYQRFNNELMPLNMNFHSKTCGACYKVVGEKTNFVKICGNAILCECENWDRKLHKQDYTDGTSFYCLLNQHNDFCVDECDKDLNKLLLLIERYKKHDIDFMETYYKGTPYYEQKQLLIADYDKLIKAIKKELAGERQ